MRIRSLLYVPADNERFIAKAHERGADAIVLDLEDSVRPENKEAARAQLAASVKSAGQAGALVFVRINAVPELAKLDAEAAHSAGAFGLYVSKADLPSLQVLNGFLDGLVGREADDGIRLVALIEDPGSVLDAREIARQERVMALTVGGEDLASLLGAEADAETLRMPKLLVHYAAKAEGLMSFGMFETTAHYSDTDAVARNAREAQRHGFDGASCVHPSAVAAINEGFSPSADQIDWAKRVVAAAQGAERGATSVDGRMVDEPVLTRARRILQRAGH